MASHHHLGKGSRGSGRIKWLILILVISTAFLFRKGMILLGVKMALGSVIGKGSEEWGYEQIAWNGDLLELVGFHWKQGERQIQIDSSQIEMKVDWLHAKILAHIVIEHPQILLEAGAAPEGNALLFPALFSHPRLGIHWEMHHGVLQFPSSLPVSRLFFSFAGGDLADQLGTFTLSYEPQPAAASLLTVDLLAQENRIGYRFHVLEGDCGRIVPLLPFLSSDPSLHWKDADGQISIDGHGSLDSSLEIADFHCKITGDHLSLSRAQDGLSRLIGNRQFGAHHLEAEVSYYPTGEKKGFLEEIVARIEVQDGNWSVINPVGGTSLALEKIDLSCVLAPYTDPEIEMKGILVQGERKGPLQISGRGSVQPDGRYWVETRVAMGSESQGLDAVISLCQPEEDQHILHIELERADADYVNAVAQIVSISPQCKEGRLHGKMLLEFSQGICTRLSLDQIGAEGFCLSLLEEKGSFSADQLEFSADMCRGNGEPWFIEKGSMALHGGACALRKENAIHISQIEGDLSVIDDALQPSSLTAQVGKMPGGIQGGIQGGIRGRIDIHGAEAEHFLETHWEGDAGALCALFFPNVIPSSSPCRVEGALMKNASGWDWIGECAVGEESVQWGVEVLGPTSLAQMGEEGLAWAVSEGWARSEKLTESTYAPFARAFLKDVDLKGEIDFFGTFRDSRWNCSIQGDNLSLEHPLFSLTIPQLGKKDPQLLETEGRALLSYDLENHSLVGDLPLQEGKLVYKNFTLDHLNGHIQIKDALVHDQELNTVCRGLTIGGEFFDLHIPVSEQTYFSNVSCALHYDALRGEIVVKNGKGRWVLADGTDYQIQLDHFEFNPQRSLFDVKILDVKKEIGRFNGQLARTPFSGWELEFDQDLTHFYGTTLQMGKAVFSQDGDLLFFEMHPLLKMKDLQKQLKFLFSSGLFAAADFDPSAIEELELTGALDTDLKWEDQVFHFKAQGKEIFFKGQKVEEFKLIGKKEKDRWIIDRLQADRLNTKAVVDVQDKKLSFSGVEGSWNQLFWKGSGAYLHEEKNIAVVIDSLQGDLSSLAGLTSQIDPKWQGTFALSARVQWELFSQTVNGECAAVLDLLQPFAVRIKQDAPLHFSYVLDEGLQLRGIEPKLFVKNSMQYLGTMCADGIFQKEQWDLYGLSFSFSPECIQRGIDAKLLSQDWKNLYYESYLEGKGDLHCSANNLQFKGSLRDGRYGIKEQIYSLQNVALHYDNGLVQCQFKTALNQQPLWGALRVDLNGAPFGSIHISDHVKPEGIEAIFRSNGAILCWDSIQGSACGIDVQLKAVKGTPVPHATFMNGTINIDGSRLDAFFPKAMQEKFKNLKLGKGYEFQGDLVLWQDPKKGFQLNGQLLGRQFELLGYQFDRLRAQLEATPEQIQISKLLIDDEAGLFQLKKIAINQNSSDQKWSFYIPLLQIKDLQPSLMKKIDSRTATVKPLVIRNLSLSEIRGDLNDAHGWAGEGHLNFTNAFKKESTIFEAPIEMIKNFGLDPGLLTPIQGEIDLELRGDKFYLVNMKNSFSDGKRAQFFLSPFDQTSYIDLNGNIHIDILMRQDVVLKLTEAFTLTVRGTLDKPRYGLQ